MKNRVYLSLGSNVDREVCYPEAIKRLGGLGSLQAVSQVYQTTPVGMDGADDFFNGAVLLLTDLGPEALKAQLVKQVEAPMGRRRDPDNRFISRTIDVDISLWNNQPLVIRGQRVPDPDILRHLHVALPLAEIAGDLVHPETGQTLAEIARHLCETEGPLPFVRADIVLEYDATDKD